MGNLVDFTPEDFDTLMSVNLKGTYFCCQQTWYQGIVKSLAIEVQEYTVGVSAILPAATDSVEEVLDRTGTCSIPARQTIIILLDFVRKRGMIRKTDHGKKPTKHSMAVQ